MSMSKMKVLSLTRPVGPPRPGVRRQVLRVTRHGWTSQFPRVQEEPGPSCAL
jgi:hypothetical protein